MPYLLKPGACWVRQHARSMKTIWRPGRSIVSCVPSPFCERRSAMLRSSREKQLETIQFRVLRCSLNTIRSELDFLNGSSKETDEPDAIHFIASLVHLLF